MNLYHMVWQWIFVSWCSNVDFNTARLIILKNAFSVVHCDLRRRIVDVLIFTDSKISRICTCRAWKRVRRYFCFVSSSHVRVSSCFSVKISIWVVVFAAINGVGLFFIDSFNAKNVFSTFCNCSTVLEVQPAFQFLLEQKSKISCDVSAFTDHTNIKMHILSKSKKRFCIDFQ